METQLTALERKIDNLLASVDVSSNDKVVVPGDEEQEPKRQS